MAPLSPEEAIRRALAARKPGATICPTDAARLLSPADWRAALPAIHGAARALASAGEVSLSRRGVPVEDPQGAYRIGLPRPSPSA